MPILLRRARVQTPARPDATALVLDGGRIAWLGDETGADRHRDLPSVDLDNDFVTPAFVDAHLHTTDTGLALTGLDLRGCPSLAEALDRVAAAARRGGGRPVLGGGWDETIWPERRPPTAAELDRAAGGVVVYLARVDIHSAVVSSALLAPDTTEGWVREPVHDAVRAAALHALSRGQRRDAQRAARAAAAAAGIASMHEMAGPAISTEDDLADLLALARDEPGPEVIGYWGELGPDGIRRARDLGAAGAGGDLFCDGSLGSHTAALRASYTDRPDTRGLLRCGLDDLTDHIVACDSGGLATGFHAIGDAAVDRVLDAFETAGRRLGRPVGAGHRIEHAECVAEPARLASSGLVASMQPVFDALWGGADGMYAARLGPGRARATNRFADLAAAGVPLAFGSDSPVTGLGPWAAVRAAVHPHDASAGLTLPDAIAAHTSGGRRAAGQPPADLVVGAAATFTVSRAEAADRRNPHLPSVAPEVALPEVRTTVRDGRVIGGEPMFSTAG